MVDLEKIYSKHAQRFDDVREGSQMEIPYLLRVADVAEVAEGSKNVLDLGCGSGQPIARFFIENDYRVVGVDFSTEMLKISRERFPEMTWLHADMRSLALDEEFDIVVAWDSYFHLPIDDQRAMFTVFQKHLRVGGALMLTSGNFEGAEVGGDLFGDPLFHASLNTAEYAERFKEIGCEVVLHTVEDPECGGHTIWIARRTR